MGGRWLGLAAAACSCFAQEVRPPNETQVVQVGGGIAGEWIRRLQSPYVGRPVSAIDFRNTGRLSSLIRAGRLYLTLDDAIALALENNLDIQLQRDNPAIARNDIKRTEGGGLPRGVLLEIKELPAGIGGPGSPLLTTVGGVTPITSIPSNSADLAPIQGQQVTLSVLGSTPLSLGSRIPQFDPVLAGTLNYQRQSIPETSVFLAGTNPLVSNTVGGNLGYTQGFSPGTSVNVGFNSSRFSSNSSRADYNPYTAGNVALTVTQPLLQGFGIGNNRRFIRIAKNNEKISDEVFRQQLIDTLASVVRLYWDLVSLNEDVRVKRQALALAEKLYQNNKAQVEVGTLAPIEVKRAQAEVARGRQDLTNSEGLVLQQELILKTILTRRGTSDPVVSSARLVPSDRIQVPAREPVREVGALVESAVRNRPDLEQARLQITNSEIGLKGSRNALLPELDLVGTLQNNGLSGDVNGIAVLGGAGPRAVDPAFLG
ncbi:MAG: TolC family protein, partial [Acidobacteriota bacterium]|nr:TolC family protein [Acidobacteriota bacterium]